jgi:hypothetical protein
MNDKNSIRVVDRNAIEGIISILKSKGFITVAPTIRDKTIIYDEIENTSELPIGWTDEQEAGHYRIKKRKMKRCSVITLDRIHGKNISSHLSLRSSKQTKTENLSKLKPFLLMILSMHS